jgi:transposase
MSLRQQLKQALLHNAALEARVVMLEKKNHALEMELRKYKNSNTPPSANQHLKADVKPRSSRKRGAPKGHRGTNRGWNHDVPKEHITATECPGCHGKNINVLDKQFQQVDDVPSEIRPVTKTIERDICECKDCHLKFVASDNKTPLKGRFGVNLMVLVIFLRFIVRGVMRKTAMFLDASFALSLAPASVQAIIARAAEAGAKEYEEIKLRIRCADRLHIDETSFSVLGKKWWVWSFSSKMDKLIVIRQSRGNDVLEEILGKNYTGIIHCDCWRAYDYLSNATLQRCWAHLLRKSKELTSIRGRHFHQKLNMLFDEIKTFNAKEHTPKQRAKKYKTMTTKLEKITKQYTSNDDCIAVVRYINFHLESWFTCIKFKNVEPTNNLAEQAIRETVIIRKIIGAFRSVKGVTHYETLASLLATWQTQQKDIKKELYRTLTTHLC